MTTATMFAVFENFNDPRDEAPAPQPDVDPAPVDDIGEIQSTAWTEGYLTGRQECAVHTSDQQLTAKLLTSVHDLESTTAEAVDAASLVVADLLISTVMAATADRWSERLMDRVRLVADRIKPALTVAPEFVLRDDDGTEQHFADMSDLARVLETSGTGEDVTIRWHRGEATISRMAILEDLREAIVPLLADRINEQNARNQT